MTASSVLIEITRPLPAWSVKSSSRISLISWASLWFWGIKKGGISSDEKKFTESNTLASKATSPKEFFTIPISSGSVMGSKYTSRWVINSS
ncbi:hypothetical protein D9M68_970100 [compost metagenome]